MNSYNVISESMDGDIEVWHFKTLNEAFKILIEELKYYYQWENLQLITIEKIPENGENDNVPIDIFTIDFEDIPDYSILENYKYL